ncbi:Glucose-repressible alcohol dehydrogenase transcriptional effector [Paramarasmius palmivorus]|uniref:Glucose-repressible alcohol dehydrogenase transcriptional effector n=1 Tax=Paramarasmius palmivorus TaxID=297713 RepID=A0AAW0DN88_9AGAR
MDTLPPEILARIFEIGIHAWGTTLISKLSHTCRHWKSVVDSTPRLWGIIQVSKKSKRLDSHLTKAREAPLSVTVSGVQSLPPKLLSLARNWEFADVSILSLQGTRRDQFPSLEVLVLKGSSWREALQKETADAFFDGEHSPQSSLRSLTVDKVSNAKWVTGFLSPLVTYLKITAQDERYPVGHYLRRTDGAQHDVLSYLRRTPKLAELHIGCISIRIDNNRRDVHLPNLSTLCASQSTSPNTPECLAHICAPALQTLSISNTESTPSMWHAREIRSCRGLFTQWSHPSFIPVHLHTLELRHCLGPGDIPFLIRWLYRLPHLVRLIVQYDSHHVYESGESNDTEESNLLLALSLLKPVDANTQPVFGRRDVALCPSLYQLTMEVDVDVLDLLAVVKARGSRSSNTGALQVVYAPFCGDGTMDDVVTELKSSVHVASCTCLGCELEICASCQQSLNEPPSSSVTGRRFLSLTPKSSANDSFTVLCYNILCEQYASPNLYPYVPRDMLAWKSRKQRILEEIVHYRCDFVCLQEVDWAAYENFFVPGLGKEDYEGVYCPAWAKTMGAEKIRPTDGCAVFFRKNRYRLLEKKFIEYTDLAQQRQDLKTSNDVRERLLSRGNIAVLCLLESLTTGKHILLVNTHIFWDPKFKDVKLVQVGLLTEEIARMRNAGSLDTPVILCGDFNSLPDSGVYEFLSSGSVPKDHPDFMNCSYGRFTSEGMNHDLGIRSANATDGKERFPWTHYVAHFNGVLDYIWYSSAHLEINTILGEADSDYIEREKVVGLPNAHFPSDHIAILGEFSTKTG